MSLAPVDLFRCTATSIEKVKLTFRDDRRQSLRDIADNTGINQKAICQIVTEDLGMVKVSAKVVPKNLTCDQKLT